jgi:diguanylate cyclase (GGDEF)-like protein
VARLGGDEFAILGEVVVDGTALSDRVMGSLEKPCVVNGSEHRVRASIGIVELHAVDQPINADELLQRADAAMYVGKRRGKSQVVHYEPQRILQQPGHRPQQRASELLATPAGEPAAAR